MIFDDYLTVLRAASYVFAVIGGSIAIWALRHNSKTNRSKFILELTNTFLSDDEARKFWYRLDYDDWHFDLKVFRQSSDERCIDTLLTRFSVAGQLLRNGSVSHADLVNIYPIVRQFFSNIEIRNYLRFNMIDFWRVAGHTHLHWPDATYLYNQQTRYQVKNGLAKPEELEDCVKFLTELERIPFEKDVRQLLAKSVRYDRDLD